MDPVSHAALGAVAGQIVGHRRLGYRAAVVGALAAAAPDLDVLLAIGGDYFDQLVLHRGITHSLVFAPVAGPIVGWLVWRFERTRGTAPPHEAGRLTTWMLLVSAALLSHPLLDVLTSYGTQLLLPFSDARFAIDAMPIIDPIYTLMLCSGLWLAARALRQYAQAVAIATVVVSSAYLGAGWVLNEAAEREARRQLAAEGVVDVQVAAFPTILQIHYRRLVARTATEDRVGHISMWHPCPIVWRSADRYAGPATERFLATREGHIFDWFTMGWLRFQRVAVDDGVMLRAIDLRYGFTDDPNQSIFSVFARLDRNQLGPMQVGRNASDVAGQRLAALFQETYAPLCTAG